MRITVIGCGRWGSLIAWYLDRTGHAVTLYGRPGSRHMQRFLATRRNDLLELPESIRLSTDLSCVRQAEIVVISICLDIHLYLWIADVHYRIFRVRHIVRDGGVDGHGHRRKAADDPHHQHRAEQDACRNEDDAFCFLCHNRTPPL